MPHRSNAALNIFVSQQGKNVSADVSADSQQRLQVQRAFSASALLVHPDKASHASAAAAFKALQTARQARGLARRAEL